jgi:hypothetical protein
MIKTCGPIWFIDVLKSVEPNRGNHFRNFERSRRESEETGLKMTDRRVNYNATRRGRRGGLLRVIIITLHGSIGKSSGGFSREVVKEEKKGSAEEAVDEG